MSDFESPIVLSDAGSTASILPDYGFNCFEFRAQVGDRSIDVIDSSPDFAETRQRASGNGIPILFPFPNRIRDGRFSWDGQDYQIPLSPDRPNAIHGFALDTPWRVIERGANRVVGEWQLSRDDPDRAAAWPTDCLIQVAYELSGATLRSKIRIINPDTRPMPWGFGTHAYFRLPLGEEGSVERCLIEAPVGKQWELEDCLPTGNIVPIPAEKDVSRGAYVRSANFDDVLTGVTAQGDHIACVIMDEQSGLEVIQACDPRFREIVVYTPADRDAVCMEPYTCVTDAINLEQRGVDAGWHVLEPGETYETWIDITARPVIV
ncbi:MAG: aldose 1-epimerase [Planctomycetota bacterium]|nr:MAG: aldose 1-epimerase [Planctomycetota bacterium]REJ97653.1 MAG: aldose 1-epimerase [Planctomycetota bacterium]REK19915.1 MAG: aldose 1-epimerase [Planctomycetota bacterium]REK27480.1 MAG: aldose 1-epimerase [Planctomycetota bacterium]